MGSSFPTLSSFCMETAFSNERVIAVSRFNVCIYLVGISVPRSINIRTLKMFALTQMPKDQPLRDILLAENEELDIYTFLARLPIWLQLSKLNGKGNT